MALAIFDRVRGRKKEADQRRLQSWEQLINRVVTEQADESEIESTLAALGRNDSELESEVVLRLKRQDKQAIASEIPHLQQGLRDVQVARDRMHSEFNAEFAALRQRLADETEALRIQEGVLQRNLAAASEAASWLTSNQSPQITTAAAGVLAEITARRAEIRDIQDYHGEQRSSGRAAIYDGTKKTADMHRIEQLKKEIEELCRELSRIESGGV